MPKYTYVCQSCQYTVQRYESADVTKTICLECGSEALRNMPTLNGPSNVTEVIDKYTGVTHRREQKDEVQERKAEYYWSVEVPRFVQSGVYSMETMVENGWVWFDDKKQMHVNTKPPQKR